MEQNTETIKFITVLNQTGPAGRVINAGLHAACGLMRRMHLEKPAEVEGWGDFRDYRDADGNSHALVSARSLIVLQAKPNELRKLRNELKNAGVLFVDFHNCMQDGTADEQMSRAAVTPEQQLEYMAIAAVGPRSIIDPLTKRLSLWRN